jgi:tetratricopeptide (TPR) repeat protein
MRDKVQKQFMPHTRKVRSLILDINEIRKHFILSAVFIFLTSMSVSTQQLEPTSIDGRPALKYTDKNGCESPVNFGKIAGHEEAIMIRVSHFHGVKWGEKGWLGITRNRIFFAADADQVAEHAFSIPRSEFKEAKVSKDGKVFYLTVTSKIKKNQEFAIACFGKMLDTEDMFIPILNYAVLASNDFDAGVKEFERLAVKLQPQKSDQDKTLADLLAPAPNETPARPPSNTGAKTEAKSGDANRFFNLGKTHLKLSLYDEAIKAFKDAIQVKADFAEAHNGLGDAYLYSGRPQEAITAYMQAIKLNPNYAEAYNGLGVAYADTYQPEESLRALKQAIRLRPDSPANFYFAGLAYKKLGKRKEAIEALREAIRLHSKFEDAYNALGVIYFDAKDYDAAIDVYKSLVQLKPDSVEAHSRLANSLFYLGRNQEAIREYELLIKLNPKDPSNYHNIGNTYAKMDRFDEAITNYKKAIAIKSDYVPSHYMLGRAFFKRGDKALAIEEYNILKSLDANAAKLLLDEISKK